MLYSFSKKKKTTRNSWEKKEKIIIFETKKLKLNCTVSVKMSKIINITL